VFPNSVYSRSIGGEFSDGLTEETHLPAMLLPDMLCKSKQAGRISVAGGRPTRKKEDHPVLILGKLISPCYYKIMKKSLLLLVISAWFISVVAAQAQDISAPPVPAPVEDEVIEHHAIATPQETGENRDALILFDKRLAARLTPYNLMAYGVQYAVRKGVSASTVTFILMLPFLATLVAFVRHIIGLPSLEMFVPIALAITLVATGLAAGFALLVTILLASLVSRFVLKKIRIMQLPKMALSTFVVSLFVFIALIISGAIEAQVMTQLSIFPILIFIFLSDKIVALNLVASTKETIIITAITIGLGIIGYALLSLTSLKNAVLLYPELILLTVPVNLLVGRYFGLRASEYIRFASLHARK